MTPYDVASNIRQALSSGLTRRAAKSLDEWFVSVSGRPVKLKKRGFKMRVDDVAGNICQHRYCTPSNRSLFKLNFSRIVPDPA